MRVHDDLDKPAETAARHIEKYLAEKDDVLFLTAGGSSLTVFDHLSPAVAKQTNMTVGVLDERLTTKDENNNFTQLLGTPWGKAVQQKQNVQLIDTAVSQEDTLPSVAGRLLEGIKQWQIDYPDGTVIALAGIGEDGHIAGMLPTKNPTVFTDRFGVDAVVVGYEDDSIENKFTCRITTTLQFFRTCLDQVFVYAVGDSKCPALRRLLQESGDVSEFPAWVLKDCRAELFTDCYLNYGS